MKSTKSINIFCLLALLVTSSLRAEEINMPQIEKPSVLNEGTQTELTVGQIAEILPWAKNSKLFLTDLLDNIHSLNTEDKIDSLAQGIKQVVEESNLKNSELFMRYILNRGLVIVQNLDREVEKDSVGSSDVKLRTLMMTIKMAIKYSELDLAKLTNSKMVMPFAKFGITYFTFLNELNKSVFDASAQYALSKISLEWLQWDLYRDVKNTNYAPQILKINNFVKGLPTRKLTDAQSISYIRQIRNTIKQLNLSVEDSEKEIEKARTKDELMFTARSQEIGNKDSQLQVDEKVFVSAKNDYGYVVTFDNNRYVIRFSFGTGGGWGRNDLSITRGCNGDICVGSRVFVTSRSAFAKVVALSTNGTFVLYFESGIGTGAGWSRSDISLVK